MKRFISIIAFLGCAAFLTTAGGVLADSKEEFVGSQKCQGCHSEEFKS